MATLGNIVYISNEDYATLLTTGTVTVDGVTITYSPNDVYITPDTAYTKPADGIPETDLSESVQESLDKADSALQEHQSLAAYRTSAAQDVIDSGKENTSNKVTSISSSSTDTQYPSAKCVYDLVGNVESLMEALL